jgi:hypothetical protein
MEKQITNTILMIEPIAFGFNEETAQNNYFQKSDNSDATNVQENALREFRNMVAKLELAGINVIVVKDTLDPATPDSIFPNNWISFHENGNVVLYPMYAKNRRLERRSDILDVLTNKGHKILDIIDYTPWESENCYLEGTGSMILDRQNKIAYAALSERTDKTLFLKFCEDLQFKPVYFIAYQNVNNNRLPIYHTNVMMCIADQYAVVCLECIDKNSEREAVTTTIIASGKEIIEISVKQMHSFAGNMLQVENTEGKRFIVLSKTAFDSLNSTQKERLSFYNQLITIEIPTIEKYGGGSVRCMMAEVFNY